MPADRGGERLVRRLGLWSAVAVLVGSTIGSGIFRTPASVAQRVDDVPLFLLAWVVGGIVVLCGALTYSELAAKQESPLTGLRSRAADRCPERPPAVWLSPAARSRRIRAERSSTRSDTRCRSCTSPGG